MNNHNDTIRAITLLPSMPLITSIAMVVAITDAIRFFTHCARTHPGSLQSHDALSAPLKKGHPDHSVRRQKINQIIVKRASLAAFVTLNALASLLMITNISFT